MASKLLRIGFIGGGKMAQALAKGFISAGEWILMLEIVSSVSRLIAHIYFFGYKLFACLN